MGAARTPALVLALVLQLPSAGGFGSLNYLRRGGTAATTYTAAPDATIPDPLTYGDGAVYKQAGMCHPCSHARALPLHSHTHSYILTHTSL